jgi:hypothetical protein
MLPSSTFGTCDGFAEPLGHCKAREGTYPVEASETVPAILKDTTHPFGLPEPEEADVHAEDLPLFELTLTLAEVLK